MRYALACLALFMAIALSANAAKPAAHVMFADWLEQRTAKAAPAPAKTASGAASYYDQADMETAYFKEAAVNDCRCVGCTDYCAAGSTPGCDNPACCSTFYTKSVLACYPKSDYDTYDEDRRQEHEFFTVEDMEIGTCENMGFAFDTPVTMMTDSVIKIGTFQSVCTLTNGGKCGHPFCDDMIITFSGTAYGLLEAVSTTNDTTPAVDNACANYVFGATVGPPAQRRQRSTFNSPFWKALKQFRQSAGMESQQAKKAPVADTAYYHHEEGPTYYKSDAALLSGTATITSRKYNLKYREGFVDFVEWDPAGATKITRAEAASKHLVKPFTYTLQLKKPAEYN